MSERRNLIEGTLRVFNDEGIDKICITFKYCVLKNPYAHFIGKKFKVIYNISDSIINMMVPYYIDPDYEGNKYLLSIGTNLYDNINLINIFKNNRQLVLRIIDDRKLLELNKEYDFVITRDNRKVYIGTKVDF